MKNIVINSLSLKKCPFYNASNDGKIDEPILSVPYTDSQTGITYCATLTGPSIGLFSSDDEESLKKILPHYIVALENSITFSLAEDCRDTSETNSELLDVAEALCLQYNTDQLLDFIMERGKKLTNANRCSVFVVDESKTYLVTKLQSGLSNSIRIPIDKGIAGHTFTNKSVLNISDAYNSEYFDPSVDKSSGYRTKTVLSVPIFNTHGDIIGVTEMINKNNDLPFTENGMTTIQIFNVFAGISLENSMLTQISSNRKEQLDSLLNLSVSITSQNDIKSTLSTFLSNARKSIQAECATLYLYNEIDSSLT